MRGSGKLTVTYIASCWGCNLGINAQTDSQEQAERVLTGVFGWVKLPRRGWTCPICATRINPVRSKM